MPYEAEKKYIIYVSLNPTISFIQKKEKFLKTSYTELKTKSPSLLLSPFIEYRKGGGSTKGLQQHFLASKTQVT